MQVNHKLFVGGRGTAVVLILFSMLSCSDEPQAPQSSAASSSAIEVPIQTAQVPEAAPSLKPAVVTESSPASTEEEQAIAEPAVDPPQSQPPVSDELLSGAPTDAVAHLPIDAVMVPPVVSAPEEDSVVAVDMAHVSMPEPPAPAQLQQEAINLDHVRQGLIQAPVEEWSVQQLPDNSILLVPPVQGKPVPGDVAVQLRNMLETTGWHVTQPAPGHMFLFTPHPLDALANQSTTDKMSGGVDQ